MASDKVVRAAAISYGSKEQLHSTVLWKSVRVCYAVRTEHEWWGKHSGWEAHHREEKWKETGLWDKSLNSERMLGGPTWPMVVGGGLSHEPGTQNVCLILLAVSYPFCWCWERGTPTATWGTKEGTGPTALLHSSPQPDSVPPRCLSGPVQHGPGGQNILSGTSYLNLKNTSGPRKGREEQRIFLNMQVIYYVY